MKNSAPWRFIFLIGLVSLFADITYEGGRGLAGPFLFSLGASATVVGFISGLGEMVGYGLRLLFGMWSQRTGRYWSFTLIGFAINLASVPLLAIAGSWPVASVLLVCERFGKSIRAPSKDTLLSHATSAVGHGKGFGFHQAMDQLGAMLGPLIGAYILMAGGGYRGAFGLLVFPAALSMVLLLLARRVFPNPGRFEPDMGVSAVAGKLPRSYWIYLVGAGFLAFGFADFSLIAFHLIKSGILTQIQAPLSYSLAMGVSAVTALAFGFLFDRIGLKALPAAAVLAGVSVPLAFSNNVSACWIGIVLWAATLGAQDSSLKAGIARLVSKERRAGAYGIFHAVFGVSWFLGSAAMGWLYDHNLKGVITVAVAAQALSASAFLVAGYFQGKEILPNRVP